MLFKRLYCINYGIYLLTRPHVGIPTCIDDAFAGIGSAAAAAAYVFMCMPRYVINKSIYENLTQSAIVRAPAAQFCLPNAFFHNHHLHEA